jgi:hypothetical protein
VEKVNHRYGDIREDIKWSNSGIGYMLRNSNILGETR